jgi:hypothetical protein
MLPFDRFKRPPHARNTHMDNEKPRIRIELTEDQKQKIKQASGEEISVIEFTMQELEERIAPRVWQK